MSAFRYRLEPLLEQKQEARKEAERAAIERERELQAETDRLEALERRERELTERRSQMRREILGKPGGEVVARQAEERAAYIRAIGEDIEAARNDVFSQRLAIEECEERLNEARRAAEDARREVEVLNKHRARQEQRFLREAQAKEELELDEIGNALYMTRRQSS